MGARIYEYRCMWPRSINWRRAWARWHRSLSLGIAGRLASSFAIIALLAVAANLFIERGVEVVETTRIDRGQSSPVLAAHHPPGAGDSADTARQVPAQQLTPVALDRLAAAVERHQHAVEMRVSVDSSETSGALHTTLHGIDLELRGIPEAFVTKPFKSALSRYQLAAVDYVESADARRTTLRHYQERLDASETRISTSIDRALKIFGRVIARQSMMRLHSQVEELQRRLGDLQSDPAAPDAFLALTRSEQGLAAAFVQNEAGLARSEGSAWTQDMRDNLARMGELHRTMEADNATLREHGAAFGAARAALLAALSAPALAAAPGAQPTPALRGGGALPTAIDSPVVGAATTTTTTSSIAPDRDFQIVVACVTGAVLVLWLAISVWTMRSILRPVGGLIRATRKLAGGDVEVRVPRGGLKELDLLAVAFNRMAAQLRTAREITHNYRRTLEVQVEQRTRLLQHLAERDPLTLLANRRQFFVLLNRSLERAREMEHGVAVFFIDLDNFKNLNDSMGHAFGDRVLISVAQRLEETAQGLGFAARLGGDEFTLVHEETESRQAVYETGRSIVEAFQPPLDVDGRAITVSVSVGASLYPDHERSAEELLSAADAALFHAKALGRNQLALFTPQLLETASRKFTTEQGVRRALEHGEFELVYQPEVKLESLKVGLVEALVRWRLPDGRLAAPDEFLAVTEESGLILELGNWVLREAIETAAEWHHGVWPEVKVAINVSPRQLLDRSFVDRVQALLREFRLPARCIELELTESVLQTGAATIDSLGLLRALDIAIALDDFGTGYSSFASLEQLPLSRIKLDRSLIAGIDVNMRSSAITTALISLCEDLGIEVTAEGVERDSQFACLAAHRAMYLQGYLISRPAARQEIPALVESMPQRMQDLLLSIPAPGPRVDTARRAARSPPLTVGAAKR
jgi:diguanylate cyclase (GGDEF)-like protein